MEFSCVFYELYISNTWHFIHGMHGPVQQSNIVSDPALIKNNFDIPGLALITST